MNQQLQYDEHRPVTGHRLLPHRRPAHRRRAATIWRRTRDFVDDEVLPVINDYWENAELPCR